ncbi:hypothetical protein BC827DRAFT_1251461 [Russula dissimulans]|nr:hypothetical protein BC827DRAFT_1251461 [Russula dissimulans]
MERRSTDLVRLPRFPNSLTMLTQMTRTLEFYNNYLTELHWGFLVLCLRVMRSRSS